MIWIRCSEYEADCHIIMDGTGLIVFGVFILVILIIVIKKSIRVVHQGTFMVVERVGRYQVLF